MTGAMAIKLVSIEVQRSGSMLRSSSCVPHGSRGLVSRLQVSLAEPPHISVILMDRRIDKVPQRNGFMRLLAII